MTRPLVAIPARFSASASVLRFAAEVTARKLADAVFAAGGEPLAIHPSAPEGPDADLDPAGLEDRLGFAAAVLLPGGGDVDPGLYGGPAHDAVYDVDREQDRFDLAVARWATATGRPLLAICRGLQVVNVARGGTLVAHMTTPHLHQVSDLELREDSRLHDAVRVSSMRISCFHHQAVDRLGTGLLVTARAGDGTAEAVELEAGQPGWFLGLQWHPEDTAATDPSQAGVFAEFVRAARAR